MKHSQKPSPKRKGVSQGPRHPIYSLMGYQNPNKSAYDPLIAAQASTYDVNLDANYSMFVFYDFHKSPIWETVKAALRGGILIDLGCGASIFSRYWMTKFANDAGARHYVGVDVHFPWNTEGYVKELFGEFKDVEPVGEMRVTLVEADMLRFASAVRDGSANFVMNGIDGCVLGYLSHPTATGGYEEALGNEMVRATKKSGIVFGHRSEPLFSLKRRIANGGFPGMEYIRSSSPIGDDVLFRKR